MRWIGDSEIAHGMVVREFEVRAESRQVPGILWTPRGASGKLPLVLIGHGGSQHKSEPGIVDLARRFIGIGFAAAAIDGPIHGSRRADHLTGPAMQAEFRAMWDKDQRIDPMVADWKAVIAALTRLEGVDVGAIGWYGVSMGTAYGLPLLAVEPRVQAALLGMWGTNYPHSERLPLDAPKVRCEVLFQMKWDDQFFTREGQFELFDRIGSTEKWLKAYLGAHTPVAGEQLHDAVEFLARKLRG
jgi:dienelactone hydrolase